MNLTGTHGICLLIGILIGWLVLPAVLQMFTGGRGAGG